MNTNRINVQLMSDNEMFDWLMSMMINNNFSANLSTSNKLQPLKEWIIAKTFHIFKNTQTTLGNRIFYLVNDIHVLPHCRTCRKCLNVQFTAYSTIYDYEHCFCSSSCLTLDPDVRHKIEQTTLKNHGYKYSFEDPKTHTKAKQTMMDKYGVEYPMQCKEIANKVAATNLNRYGCISPFGNKNVQEKLHKTWLEKYGVDNPVKSPEIRHKILDTVQSRYGVDNVFKSAEIYHKGEMTRLDKYGSMSYLGTKDCIRKTRDWSLKTFGVDHHLKAYEIRKQIEETNLQTYGNKAGKAFGTQSFKQSMTTIYGVEYSMQCKEILDKAHYRYAYDNVSFDSAPEIALYIWLKDNNKQFEYQPNISFEYIYDGKICKYFPDFKIENDLIEIKGDHFFKDGKMICPYRNKMWTDEEYEVECAKYEAKHQCMLKNDVVILKSKDYIKYLNYVDEKYGSNYLKQFKNNT